MLLLGRDRTGSSSGGADQHGLSPISAQKETPVQGGVRNGLRWRGDGRRRKGPAWDGGGETGK